MTYDELTVSLLDREEEVKKLADRNPKTFGRLRKVNKLGPFGMFQRLVHEWSSDRKRGPDDDAPVYEPRQVAYVVAPTFLTVSGFSSSLLTTNSTERR